MRWIGLIIVVGAVILAALPVAAASFPDSALPTVQVVASCV